jgi:hypothetical protein
VQLFAEYLEGNADSAALNGIDLRKFIGVTGLYAPQFSTVGGLRTLLNLINANPDSEAQVTLTVHAANGQVLGNPVTLTLPRNGQLKSDLEAIFQTETAVRNATGWIEVQSSVDRVVGTVTFTSADGVLLSTFELSGVPLGHFVLPLVAEDGTYQTQISLLNANSPQVEATLELWTGAGTLDRTAVVRLAPGTTVISSLSEYFPNLGPRLSGYVRIRSTQPIHAFSQVSDRALHFLAAVPPISFP